MSTGLSATMRPMPQKPIPAEADKWRELTVPQRKEHFLAKMRGGARRSEIERAVMISDSTVDHWLRKDDEFRKEYEKARDLGRASRRQVENIDNTYDPDEWTDAEIPPINEFVWDYIGRPTPWHLDLVTRAWEDKTNRIVICLLPPGAGKDTRAGDIVLRETMDRSKKIAWVMESSQFSQRRLARLEGYYWDERAYVQPKGPDTQQPTKRVWEEFGPFKWHKEMVYPDGTKVAQPKWTQNELYFLGRENEADPNLWATGIGGAMYGARIDIAVLSDIFTEDNQNSPTQREQQIGWIIGTFLSRLDDRGRALFLGTRVAEWDNWARLIEELVGSMPVLHADEFVTKYANGVCVIQMPAIQTDDEGNERSYWEDRFSLRTYLEAPDGTQGPYVDELSDEELLEYGKKGFARIEGLYGIRGDSPAKIKWFNTAYQQNPPSGEEGEFPLALLDSCDDYERSYGMVKPGSTLVLGIDPARTGGAAWVLWEWDGETISVVDYYFGTNIGVTGLREKLLVDPILHYRPRYAIYESNRETSVLEHPEVQEAVRGARTELKGVPTHSMNRGVGELRVAAMAFDMGTGLIKWPAATQEDRKRSDTIKEQFLNWDQRERLRRVDSQIRQHIPDDIAMAAWVGWVKVKQLAQAGGRASQLPRRKVSRSIARSWGYSGIITEEKVRHEVPTDLLSLYYGKG